MTTTPPDAERLADELAERVFCRIDRNGDGRLSRDELWTALTDLGLSETQCQHQCHRMMQVGAPMDRTTFRAFCRRRVQRMYDLFHEIDTNRTEEISYDSIRRALRRVGLEADPAKVRRLIALADRDGDTRLTFDEFYSALILLPSASVADLFQNWDRASLCDLGETSAMIPPRRSSTMAPIALIAGAVSGIVSRSVTAPLDRLKLILQDELSPMALRAPLRASFARIYGEGGVRGLFRGNLANVIKVAPENAIKMWAFDRLGGFSSDESRSVLEQFAIGAAAGAVSQTVVYPLETIKTHFALSRGGQYSSLWACAFSIYERCGVRGLYRGLGAATTGIVPYAGVDLSLFAFFRRTWEDQYPHHNPSAWQLLGFGALSSTCGQLVAYPLQLIRTRLQSQGMPNRPIRYAGVVDCFRQVVRQDGYRGLYRGLQPNFIKALPSISISYAVYDLTYRYLQRRQENGTVSVDSAS